jgi:FixJ family two-component response regulator
VPALVHIVDDDTSFRKSLAKLLQASGFEVALYDSAEHLLQALPDAGLGCILLDVKMPGLSGPELQDRLAQLGSPLPIIFLSGHSDIPTTVRAVKAGAEDFLAKPIEKKALLEAIGRALERCRVTLEQREQLKALQSRVGKLTPRERKVFIMVARGHINKQIASALGTTERTIKAHRQKVMQKLNAQSLLELVAVAERLNMLNADENGTQQPL